jgi:hypothetical protein
METLVFSRTITQKYKPGRTVRVKTLSQNTNAIIAKNKTAYALKKKTRTPFPGSMNTFASPAQSNTALQNYLGNNIVYTRTGTLFNPLTTLSIMNRTRTTPVNPVFKGGSYAIKTQNPYKKTYSQSTNYVDKLANLLGTGARSLFSIPAGVGSAITDIGQGTENALTGVGQGVQGVGEGVEGLTKNNNFMWIALGLGAILLLRSK